MTHPAQAPQRLFAIVEIFGHQKIAGEVSEQSLAGTGFVRIDVPEVSYVHGAYVDGKHVPQHRTIPAHTRSLGGGAIYGISWCDEAAMLLAAQTIKHQPIKSYELREALQDLPLRDRQMLLAAPGDDDVDRPFLGPQQ